MYSEEQYYQPRETPIAYVGAQDPMLGEADHLMMEKGMGDPIRKEDMKTMKNSEVSYHTGQLLPVLNDINLENPVPEFDTDDIIENNCDVTGPSENLDIERILADFDNIPENQIESQNMQDENIQQITQGRNKGEVRLTQNRNEKLLGIPKGNKTRKILVVVTKGKSKIKPESSNAAVKIKTLGKLSLSEIGGSQIEIDKEKEKAKVQKAKERLERRNYLQRIRRERERLEKKNGLQGIRKPGGRAKYDERIRNLMWANEQVKNNLYTTGGDTLGSG